MGRSRLIILAAAVLLFSSVPALVEEVGLVTLDTREAKEVAKGHRANTLRLRSIINDKREIIGVIDDFVLGRDEGIFVVLSVGDFTGARGQLVAVPFRSLKFDERNNSIILSGASREALGKLPLFLYPP